MSKSLFLASFLLAFWCAPQTHSSDLFGCSPELATAGEELAAKKTLVLLMGPPGSGKGSVGRELEDLLEGYYFSIGELLNARSQINDEVGQLIADLQARGQTTLTSILRPILAEALARSGHNSVIIIDGLPRNEDQLKLIEDLAAQFEVKLVILGATEPTLLYRLSKRFLCSKCGQPHHTELMPRNDRQCIGCSGHNFHRRIDDQPEVIRERLAHHREAVEPLISKLGERFSYLQIQTDARAPKEIARLIFEFIVPDEP